MGEFQSMSKDELVTQLESLLERNRGLAEKEDEARQAERLLHELQVHQVELEMQNRELREAQVALEESRSRYSDLYDFAPVAYLTFDDQGRIQEMNLTGAALLGRERKLLVGRPFVAAVRLADSAPFFAHLRQVFEGRTRVSGELSFTTPAEEAVVVQVTSAPVFDAEGKVTACRSALTDVTRRQQVEAELRAQRVWLQTVIDQLPEAVVLLDERGRASYNQMALELSYCEEGRTDALGNPRLFDARLPSGAPFPPGQEPLVRALRHGEKVIGLELAIRCADGSLVPMLANAAPVRADGKVAGAVAVFQDIRVLKELERLREEWTAVIAHDLSQPLSVISISTSTLTRDQDERRAAQARAVDRIKLSLERLRRMVEDLLDVSRIEARRLRLKRRAVDLFALVQEVVERSTGALRGHPVRLEGGGALPVIFADPVRLEQVLTNLLSNAAKYGDPESEILIGLQSRKEELEVSVSNRGRGLTREDLARIFSRFYRSPSVEAGLAGGLGLGLYIVKGLVEAHGGRIVAESTPGQTTTVRFTLPSEPLQGQDGVQGDQGHDQQREDVDVPEGQP